tara:strand:+ start:912 stop:1247 length:336 start_codon:yes stop_codon:yes gene_type:complete
MGNASRFLSRHFEKIRFTGSGCWEWTAATSGKMSYASAWSPELKKMVRAHRLSFEDTFGKIPDGKFACHRCDNPLCVNPHHIFLGTQKENIRDMWMKGRARRQRDGTCKSL